MTVAMLCNSATRESGTSGTAAASDADIEALASRTCASAAQHSSATAAAATAAALLQRVGRHQRCDLQLREHLALRLQLFRLVCEPVLY